MVRGKLSYFFNFPEYSQKIKTRQFLQFFGRPLSRLDEFSEKGWIAGHIF